MEVLQALPRHEKIDFVFSTTGRTTISGFSRAKASIDSFLAARGWIPATDDDDGAWVLHDIRRTVATNFQKLGVRLEVTEAALNHVSGIYARQAENAPPWSPHLKTIGQMIADTQSLLDSIDAKATAADVIRVVEILVARLDRSKLDLTRAWNSSSAEEQAWLRDVIAGEVE